MSTLTKKIKITGVGIHSGLPVNMVVKPSKKYGIFFHRSDIPDSPQIQALAENVGETKMRNTTIGCTAGAHVQTVEHLMAALFLAGIDSAVIDIDGPETPILDGSATEFLSKFMGNTTGKGGMKKIIVRRPVIVYARDVLRSLPWHVRLQLWVINKIAGRKSDGYVKLSPNDGKSLEITAT